MFQNLKIGAKILVILCSVAIVAVGIIGVLSYVVAKSSLEEESFNKLTAVRELKAKQVEDYFGQVFNQIITFSDSSMVVDAVKKFKLGYRRIQNELGLNESDIESIDTRLEEYYQAEFLPRLQRNTMRDEQIQDYWPNDMIGRILQDLYIASNPNGTGSKHLLDAADEKNELGGQSLYSAYHEIYHPTIRKWLETFGYYDIFLIDNETGTVVYSVFKEVDYGTSLLTGPYSETNLGKAFRAARDASDDDYHRLVDFAPYAPSYDAQASFIASPIFDEEEMVGVVAFQVPADRINEIVTNRQNWEEMGLGKTGETYIVADDFRIRNQSRFLIEDRDNYFAMIMAIGISSDILEKIQKLNSTIGLQEVRTEGTIAALDGQTDTRIFDDYRGVPVLSAFRPLALSDVNWIILSEIDEQEAMAHVNSLRNNILIWLTILIAIIVFVSAVFSRSLTRPLKKLALSASELAGGNLDAQIELHGDDEIGTLATSFSSMRVSLKNMIKDLEGLNETLEQKVKDRTADLEDATNRLQESEQRLNFALEGSNDGLWDWEIDLGKTYYSPRYETMLGFQPGELEGEQGSWEKLVHPDDLGQVLEILNSHLSGETNLYEAEYRVRTKDETWMWVLARGKVVDWDSNRKALRCVGTHTDITIRKEMERQLAEANKRMEGELNVGREIQMSMLPLIFPAFPNRSEISVFANLKPAREVGGDFYDFFFINENLFCFCIGDVSGKGVPAALFMAVTKTLIKSRATDDSSPGSILTHLNDELSADNATSMFVTMFTCVLNVQTGELTYTNSGHNPPYIKRHNGKLDRLDTLHGPVVGAVGGVTYNEDETLLHSGDMLLLFTDGVTEAMDKENHLYGEDRLVDLINERGYQTTEEIVHATFQSVEHFESGAEQADDITVLAMKFMGPSESLDSNSMLHVKLRNELSEINNINEQFKSFAAEHKIARTTIGMVQMVFDEVLNNIVSYAYKDPEEREIEVEIEISSNRLIITVKDDGVPFNPFQAESPDTDSSISEREIGGLGIHLVRNVMDKVSYQRKVNHNVITLIKQLDKELD